jgi:hypothetical protein
LTWRLTKRTLRCILQMSTILKTCHCNMRNSQDLTRILSDLLVFFLRTFSRWFRRLFKTNEREFQVEMWEKEEASTRNPSSLLKRQQQLEFTEKRHF